MGSDYYYFEMRVKKDESQAGSVIGYSEEGFTLSNWLGYDNAKSVGYQGYNGWIYAGSSNGISCLAFTTNDIVGAGIDYASKRIFFTKNGELVGTVSNKLNGPLFPTVSVFDSNVELKVNFGHKPFAYDDVKIRYPFPYWNLPDDSQSPISKGDGGDGSSSTKDECWKMLMKMCESSLRKIEEEMAFYRKKKEEEVATLRTVMKDLEKHL
ncbi:Ran-binding protein M homolog [Linum grandiflorum]